MTECLIFMYCNGEIQEVDDGVHFKSKNCLSFYVKQYICFESFQQEILAHFNSPGVCSVGEITYRFPISVINGRVEYRPYVLRDNEGMRLFFDSYWRYYPNIQAAEINVEFQEGDAGEEDGDAAEEEAGGGATCEGAEGNDEEYDDSSDEDDPDFQCSEEEEVDDVEYEEDCPQSLEGPPEDMLYLDMDAMVERNPPELLNRTSIPSSSGDGLHVGMKFHNKDEVQHAIKQYSVRKFVDFKVMKSNHIRYSVRCTRYGEGCSWRLLASFRLRSQMWEITRYEGPHTCAARDYTLDHKKLDSNMICRCILHLVRKNSSLGVAVLQAHIKERFNHEPSYRKTWIGKQKAIEMIFGNWERSFEELPQWLDAMQGAVRGSVVRLETVDVPDEQGKVTKAIFRRLFWSFGPCIKAFNYCKRLVQIDGTHLYGKYRGTLLIAVSQDGNRNVVPLAFAIVEGETYEAWLFKKITFSPNDWAI